MKFVKIFALFAALFLAAAGAAQSQGKANVFSGAGSPEGVVSGVPGDVFVSSDGPSYVKNQGNGNTGWVVQPAFVPASPGPIGGTTPAAATFTSIGSSDFWATGPTYCTNWPTYDQTCINNAIAALGTLTGGGTVRLVKGVTYNVNATSTDSHGGCYGILIANGANINISGYGATINYNVNSACDVIAVEGTQLSKLEGFIITTTNAGVGNGIHLYRPAGAGNPVQRMIVESVETEFLNIGIYDGCCVGAADNFQVSENVFRNNLFLGDTSGYYQIGTSNFNNLLEGNSWIASTAPNAYVQIDMESGQNDEFITPLIQTTGTNGGTGIKIASGYQGPMVFVGINQGINDAVNGNLALTAATCPTITFYGGTIAWTGTQGAGVHTTGMNLACTGGTVSFVGANLQNTGNGFKDLLVPTSNGPYVQRYSGSWSSQTVSPSVDYTGEASSGLARFVFLNTNIPVTHGVNFDDGSAFFVAAPGSTPDFKLQQPATSYGGTLSTVLEINNQNTWTLGAGAPTINGGATSGSLGGTANLWNVYHTTNKCFSTACLFLGVNTAQTAYYSFSAATPGGTRTVTLTDPGQNTNLPFVIASGTSTMVSGSVSGATCAAAVTTTATGAAATDSIEWAYAAAPTLTTDALLHISPYTTSGNVNFTRCNATAASITGTAIVINWRVIR